jgi:RNase P/RNase MRP subunit POP5
MKPLLSSFRERKRYLAFEIVSKTPIEDFKAVSSAIWSASLQFLGELECGKAGIMILHDKFDKDRQRGLIRVNHTYVDKLRASISLIDNIDDKKVLIRSRGVSGIMKKAEGKFIAG